MQTVILAGGKGTRMGDLTREIPKPLIAIAGKPILEHQIELVKRYGHTDIILLTGYRGEKIRDYFGNGSRWGVTIRYQQETKPLGTGGALRAVENMLDSSFFVLYGDIIMDIDLDEVAAFHARKNPSATLVVHPNSHPYDSDLLEMDGEDRITAFHRKPHAPGRYHHNLVNAGAYVISRELLNTIPAGTFSDLGRDIFPPLTDDRKALAGYRTAEYLVDVGTVDRLQMVTADVVSGKVARLNRKKLRRAVFLDRDGVINEERDPVAAPEKLNLLPGVVDAIKKINRSEFCAVVVTNQPMIAKGFATENDLDRIHAKLETLLGAEHAYLDRMYHCPHHPEKGFAGERPELKIPCECRKPSPGMVYKAASDLNLDLSNSYMVGDQTVDVQTGINAGCRTIMVKTGYAGSDRKYSCRPDAVVDTLSDAVESILSHHQPGGETA
jgi:mannose-1-phosphate guanylyltransferase / phosphomannomutase